MDDKQEREIQGKAGSSFVNEEKDFNQGSDLAPTVIKHTFAHISTAIVNAACKLEIFDHLHDNGPEMTAGALAEKMGASEMNLRRLMNACVRLELLNTRTKEDGQILYSNTDEAEQFLRKQSKRSAIPFVNWSFMFEKKFVESIDKAVMKGGPTFDKNDVFGTSKKDASMPFLFDEGMGGRCQTVQHFPHLFDFSRFHKLIDCGGGVGVHARCMKLAYPTMNVSVLEIDSFIDRMKQQGKSLDNQYFSYISGDVFKEVPSTDLCLLSNILHDWPDKDCDIILSNIYKALPSGGGLIVLEKLYNENKDSIVDLAMDMVMMGACDGKERTRDEFKLMLEKHGFVDINIWAQVANSLTDVIFTVKP